MSVPGCGKPPAPKVKPFELVDEQTIAMAVAICGVDEKELEDCFPCTPFQSSIIRISLQKVGAYLQHRVWTLPTAAALVT